jgi:hypothetical protein
VKGRQEKLEGAVKIRGHNWARNSTSSYKTAKNPHKTWALISPTFLAFRKINNLRVFNTSEYSNSPRLHISQGLLPVRGLQGPANSLAVDSVIVVNRATTAGVVAVFARAWWNVSAPNNRVGIADSRRMKPQCHRLRNAESYITSLAGGRLPRRSTSGSSLKTLRMVCAETPQGFARSSGEKCFSSAARLV